MIAQQPSFDQLPNEVKSAFHELNVLKHLRGAGFRKKFGFTCACLFRLVFMLLFHQKNWYRLLESKKGEAFPGKDTVYRFLNHSGYAWRRFLLSLSGETISRMEPLTSDNRATAFVFDDSMFEQHRSKAVEMLARFKDHATGSFYKGFRILTMGWSDGHSFVPVAGLTAPYALMDSWFTHAPLIQEVLHRGMHVIGMVKNDNKRYLVSGKRISLKELYAAAPLVEGNTPTSCASSEPNWLRVFLLSLCLFVIARRRTNGLPFYRQTLV